MSDINNTLRKCSRCHSTKLESYFTKNTKGEYFKLCDNCRKKGRIAHQKQYEQNDMLTPCPKCGVEKRGYEMKHHQKSFQCQTFGMEPKPCFVLWLLDNEETLIPSYKRILEEEKKKGNYEPEYFEKLNKMKDKLDEFHLRLLEQYYNRNNN